MRMFEQEYRKVAARPKYHTLFNDVDLQVTLLKSMTAISQ